MLLATMDRSVVCQYRSPGGQLTRSDLVTGDDLVSQRNTNDPDLDKNVRRDKYDRGPQVRQGHLVPNTSTSQHLQHGTTQQQIHPHFREEQRNHHG